MKIICDWDNCDAIGSYKAPLEKDNSKKYRLLCLEHIKIFNKKWNYFSDMTDQEVEFLTRLWEIFFERGTWDNHFFHKKDESNNQ